MKPREGSDQLGAQWILDLWTFAPDGSPSSVTLRPLLVCGGDADMLPRSQGKDRGSDILTTLLLNVT